MAFSYFTENIFWLSTVSILSLFNLRFSIFSNLVSLASRNKNIRIVILFSRGTGSDFWSRDHSRGSVILGKYIGNCGPSLVAFSKSKQTQQTAFDENQRWRAKNAKSLTLAIESWINWNSLTVDPIEYSLLGKMFHSKRLKSRMSCHDADGFTFHHVIFYECSFQLILRIGSERLWCSEHLPLLWLHHHNVEMPDIARYLAAAPELFRNSQEFLLL